MTNTDKLVIFKFYTVKEKLYWTPVKNGKEDFIQEYYNMCQDYCHRGERLNSTQGKEFLSTDVS